MAFIQSLDRAIEILELLEWYGSGISLSQISSRLGLHPSTIHHLLKTLSERGYVVQDPTTRRYQLGRKLLNFSSGFGQEMRLVATAFPHMAWLANACQENLRLGILGYDSVITIAKVESNSTPLIQTPLEQWRALHATGLGKVLLAGLSPSTRASVLARVGMPRLTSATITDPLEFEEEMARVTSCGYAVDEGEMDEGLRCVAAPIHDPANVTIAALSVATPVYRFSSALRDWLISAVPQTARQISDQLARSCGTFEAPVLTLNINRRRQRDGTSATSVR